MQKLTGAEIVVECLKEQGVDTVFGYPGGAILNIYDALYKHQEEITHILTSHEQGAAHAADGYARATGKVGVCLATSGPGATNLVTGIATAYMDSIPVVAITCNVGVSLLGKDSFQEIDIAGNNQEMNMKEPLSELYLQEAGERDCGMLFVWANDPVVRCNAFQTAHIPFETHQEWFRKVLEDNTIWQYILYHRQIPVGQIRLNIEKGVGKIDYSIAPDMRGRGFGSNVLELIKEKAENEITGVTKLMGQVKHQNTASIKEFERCGYTRTENEDYITFTLDL